jgi:hypothetical protein
MRKAPVTARMALTPASDDDRAPRWLHARFRIALTEGACARPRRGRSQLVPSERPTRLAGDNRSHGEQQRAGRSASSVRTAPLHMQSASGGSELTVLGTRHATDDGIDVRAFAFDFVDIEAPP